MIMECPEIHNGCGGLPSMGFILPMSSSFWVPHQEWAQRCRVLELWGWVDLQTTPLPGVGGVVVTCGPRVGRGSTGVRSVLHCRTERC
jgi:hypothetical protein